MTNGVIRPHTVSKRTLPSRSAGSPRRGVDVIVEVAAGSNAELDQSVLKPAALSPSTPTTAESRSLRTSAPTWGSTPATSSSYYTVGWDRIANAAADLNQPIYDGAFRVGEQAGVPVDRFGLDDLGER